MKKKASTGFTIAELMVTIAIVGILAAIAIPSYNSYVLKGHRSQAIIFVLDLAKKQEDYYNLNGRYGGIRAFINAGLGVDLRGGDYVVNDRFRFYNTVNANRFEYRLVAVNGQRDDTECRKITVNEATLSDQSNGDMSDLCSAS